MITEKQMSSFLGNEFDMVSTERSDTNSAIVIIMTSDIWLATFHST